MHRGDARAPGVENGSSDFFEWFFLSSYCVLNGFFAVLTVFCGDI